jgi:hypothetical protein
MNRVRALLKKPEGVCLLLHHVRTLRDTPSMKHSEPLPETKSIGALMVDLPTSRPVGNTCLLCISHRCMVFFVTGV